MTTPTRGPLIWYNSMTQTEENKTDCVLLYSSKPTSLPSPKSTTDIYTNDGNVSPFSCSVNIQINFHLSCSLTLFNNRYLSCEWE
jgi:hypothetical protein